MRRIIQAVLFVILISSSAKTQVIVELTPLNPPIVIPSTGGEFDYNIAVTNNDSIAQNFDVWCMCTLPNGSSYGPVLEPITITLPAGASNNRDRTQNVPENAPVGLYTLTAYIGYYPDEIWDSDEFFFTKVPETLWTQTYGGSEDDYGWSVQQTSDGGYIVAGRTESFGASNDDIYLIKTDGQGNPLWNQTYSPGFYQYYYAYSVQQTTDGGYIIAGYSATYLGPWASIDAYLVKTDGQGNLLWSQFYGGSDHSAAYSVRQTADGGYIVAGHTVSAVYLIKTDIQGNLTWSQTYGGSGNDCGRSVQQTTDGGYIVVGWTSSYGAGSSDVYLLKTDEGGNLTWNQTYGGSSWDEGYSVQQTADGGYIVVGCTHSFGAGGADVYLIKTEEHGFLSSWSQTYGGSGNDYGYSVQQTTGGGYIVAGITSSFGAGSYDVYLVKTDGRGNLTWSQTFGGSGEDCGESVQQTEDGGYIIGGYTYSFGAGGSDVYLIKTAPETVVNQIFGIPPEMEVISKPSEFALQQNYPNPFNPTTTISFQLPVASWVKLEVFDVAGRNVGMSGSGTTPTTELVDGWRDAGQHEVTFDASELASGVYIYRLQAGDYHAAGKMVLMK